MKSGSRYDRAHIVDGDGISIIRGVEVIGLLSHELRGPITHAEVKYFKNSDDAAIDENPVFHVFPLERIFYIRE